MSLDAIEEAKRCAARQAVAENFRPDFQYVGIGSGSTIKYVVESIAKILQGLSSPSLTTPALSGTSSTQGTNTASSNPANATNPVIVFVSTGYQSRETIVAAGLTAIAFDTLPDGIMLDVAFDGADEVDTELNCIKGGGSCLFQEKLVVERSRRFICVADYRKAQERLLSSWPSVPIEVAPIAVKSVLAELVRIGSVNPKLRTGLIAKAGPIKTDQAFFIIDAPFATLRISNDEKFPTKGKPDRDGANGGEKAKNHNNGNNCDHDQCSITKHWEVCELATRIKSITGVLEVGIFCGMNGDEAATARLNSSKDEGVKIFKSGQKPVIAYFGMQDGSVMKRIAKSNSRTSQLD